MLASRLQGAKIQFFPRFLSQISSRKNADIMQNSSVSCRNTNVPRQQSYTVIFSHDGVKGWRDIPAFSVKDARKRFLALFPNQNVLIEDVSLT